MIQQVIPVGKKLLIKQKKAEAFFKNTTMDNPKKRQTVVYSSIRSGICNYLRRS